KTRSQREENLPDDFLFSGKCAAGEQHRRVGLDSEIGEQFSEVFDASRGAICMIIFDVAGDMDFRGIKAKRCEARNIFQLLRANTIERMKKSASEPFEFAKPRFRAS